MFRESPHLPANVPVRNHRPQRFACPQSASTRVCKLLADRLIKPTRRPDSGSKLWLLEEQVIQNAHVRTGVSWPKQNCGLLLDQLRLNPTTSPAPDASIRYSRPCRRVFAPPPERHSSLDQLFHWHRIAPPTVSS